MQVSTTLVTNTAEFLKANQATRTRFFEQVATNLNRQELFFIGKMQQERMSGRRQDPVGSDYTRVQTGMLRRNWFNQTVAQNAGITFSVFSTTPYAPFQSARIKIGYFWTTYFLNKAREAINSAAVLLR